MIQVMQNLHVQGLQPLSLGRSLRHICLQLPAQYLTIAEQPVYSMYYAAALHAGRGGALAIDCATTALQALKVPDATAARPAQHPSGECKY